MAKKLLILGASGLTGYKSMLLAKKRFEPYGTYNMRQSLDKSLIKLDITREDALRKVFRDIRPDVVLNTTALHNVDYCESHHEEALNVNTNVVRFISGICNSLGCRLVHMSTDYVFDGKKSTSYIETDDLNPLSVYAKSKSEGEKQAKKTSSYSILRPSVVYG